MANTSLQSLIAVLRVLPFGSRWRSRTLETTLLSMHVQVPRRNCNRGDQPANRYCHRRPTPCEGHTTLDKCHPVWQNRWRDFRWHWVYHNTWPTGSTKWRNLRTTLATKHTPEVANATLPVLWSGIRGSVENAWQGKCHGGGRRNGNTCARLNRKQGPYSFA